jgi:transcriptional regulator with XRE-family HTH domain
MSTTGRNIRPIGRYLSHLREKNRWSRSKLAAMAKVDPSTILNVELGKTGGLQNDPFDRMAKALGHADAATFQEVINEWAEKNPADGAMREMLLPAALVEELELRAEMDEMSVPDLLATLLARRPGKRKKGA